MGITDNQMNLNQDAVQAAIENHHTFDRQLQAFLDAVLLSDKDVENYELVCQDLEKIAKLIFPRSKAFRFGSTANGLCFKNCDLDIYLNPSLPVTDDDEKSFGPHIVSIDNLFMIVLRTLYKNSKVFLVRCPIRFARMPIIKCVHRHTQIHCDISFKHNLGVYNTQLVRFYLLIDPRFRPLMVIIKYWINICETRSRIGFSKYALTMLFIFYLQQAKLGPAIIDLQKNCSVPLFIRGWQVNFNKTLKNFKISNDDRDKLIPDLLQGFLEFYVNYDFKENIVSVIDGKSHSKKLFNELKYLPPSMTRYKEYLDNMKNPVPLPTYKPMCVQDPIELNHNLTANIQDNHLEKFQIFCSMALNIVKNSSKNNYHDLFDNLFKHNNKLTNNCLKNKKQCINLTINSDELFRIDTDFFIRNNKSEQKLIFEYFFNSTIYMMKQFFKEVLKFEVQDKEDDNTKNKSMIIFYCRGIHQLWSSRKCNMTGSLEILNPLEKEIEITKILLREKNLAKEVSDTPIQFECHCMMKFEPRNHILLTLINNECPEKIFSSLVSHLNTKMISIIRKTFKSLNKSKNSPIKRCIE